MRTTSRGSMRLIELLENLEVNVRITIRERGKIVGRREGHNIWVDLGREYLIDRISPLSGFAPIPGSSPPELAAENNALIRFMGVGIGGAEQTVDIAATYPVLDAAYPGTNVQVDTGAAGLAVTTLERPVLVSTGPDAWIDDISTPITHPLATRGVFTRVFDTAEVNLGGVYPAVPLSEVALFLSSEDKTADPYVSGGANRQTVVGYNTFATISMTTAFSFQVDWELRL